jgi:hypothetical protein
MPFRVISRAQAERRQARRSTQQGAEVKALGSRYETAQKAAREGFRAEQQGLLSGFQQQMESYGKNLSVFEQSAKDFQARSEDYNKRVEAYQQVTPLPGTFSALPIKGRPATYLTASNIKSMEQAQVYNMGGILGQALSGVAGVDTETWARDGQTRIKGFDADKLPSNYVLKQTGFSSGGIPEYQLAQRGAEDPGEFTEKFEATAPTAPTYSGSEGLTEKYSAALKQEQDYFEREIGERKLASQRARRRVGDRPMLAGAK